eukprot:TRINITY_DN55430_c0_g1_i1.p1 TRINITY_DN55430_c0_g1~~TRINITY_DN55430_c0_g1_i1.p1  ORF type:complete len:554 (+),score=92.80 TRINITY_DN55430_c0_g1_i1:69-1730(+)
MATDAGLKTRDMASVLGVLQNRDRFSHVGKAALQTLFLKHLFQNGKAWSATSGQITGEILQTPPSRYWGCAEPAPGHSDGFPQKFYDTIIKAQHWVDISSLSPPNGKFEEAMRNAITKVALSGRAVTFRIFFGNVIGSSVKVKAVMDSLLRDVPADSKIKVWVGSYRKEFSWNHSKIVAVDGVYLLQGGHNMWEADYLMKNPVHDISMTLEGDCAVAAHRYCNTTWKWMIKEKKGFECGCIPISWLTFCRFSVDVNLAHYPAAEQAFPPMYKEPKMLLRSYVAENSNLSENRTLAAQLDSGVPMIAIGRHGAIGKSPSDDAITALLYSAKQSLYLSQQDLGPLTLPSSIDFGDVSPMPGGKWPEAYLKAVVDCLDRGVQVNIVLSNPNGGPKGGYGYGWTTEDVGAEIMRVYKKQTGKDESAIQQVFDHHLAITYIRCKVGCHSYPDGCMIGNHAKMFIVDEVAFYMGSQNLYLCNLAEWGLVVDDKDSTEKLLAEYWRPLWNQSSASKATSKAISAVFASGKARTSDRTWEQRTEDEHARYAEIHQRFSGQR